MGLLNLLGVVNSQIITRHNDIPGLYYMILISVMYFEIFMLLDGND